MQEFDGFVIKLELTQRHLGNTVNFRPVVDDQNFPPLLDVTVATLSSMIRISSSNCIVIILVAVPEVRLFNHMKRYQE